MAIYRVERVGYDLIDVYVKGKDPCEAVMMRILADGDFDAEYVVRNAKTGDLITELHVASCLAIFDAPDHNGDVDVRFFDKEGGEFHV
jgi:hypothetical protein